MKNGRSGIHAHHYLGYERPLDVRWLCARCHAHYDPRLQGEKQPFAKLTAVEVIDIRRLRATHSLRVLARQFNVSRATIIKVVKYRKWKHVGSEFLTPEI